MIKSLIKTFFKKVGYDLAPIKKEGAPEFISNVYNTKYKQTVLVSYICSPVLNSSQEILHNNIQEVRSILKTFKELEFNIDLIDYYSEKKLDFGNYKIVFGFGEPFENCLLSQNKNVCTIYYATGTHQYFEQIQSMLRLKNAYDNTSVIFRNSHRLRSKIWHLQSTFSDHAIILGNQTVLNTYLPYRSGNNHLINACAVDINFVFCSQKEENNKNFLWMGGSGLIHKGLDLLIDYFVKNPDLNLFIVGPLKSEPDFFNYFNEEIEKAPNIAYSEFLNINSIAFKEILSKSTFVLSPSCSEGQSTSVLNVMYNNGLIPIASKISGIPLENFGIEIESLSYEGLDAAIQKALNIPISELNLMRENIKHYSKTNFSIKSYENNMKVVLKLLLNK